MGIATRETYKGHAMICLQKEANSKYPFKFGVGKARMILDNLADIKQFVAEQDAENSIAASAERPFQDAPLPQTPEF